MALLEVDGLRTVFPADWENSLRLTGSVSPWIKGKYWVLSANRVAAKALRRFR